MCAFYLEHIATTREPRSILLVNYSAFKLRVLEHFTRSFTNLRSLSRYVCIRYRCIYNALATNEKGRQRVKKKKKYTIQKTVDCMHALHHPNPKVL
jgi:hypothetical protein